MHSRLNRIWFGASLFLLGLSAIAAFADQGLTRLMIPLSEMRALAGMLTVGCALMAYRANSRPTRRRVAAGVMLGGFGAAVLAVAPFYMTARGEAVRFTSEGTELAGTWYTPRAEGHHGAIVIVHGSGSITRRVYRAWAEPFLKRGMSVLVYDKRGVGDSKGLYEERRNTSRANIDLLAHDAVAAIRFAAMQSVDTTRVGFFGISQAGWIIPRAMELDSTARFAVLLGGSAVSVGEQNFFDDISGDDHLGFREAAMPMSEMNERVSARKPSGYDPREAIGKLRIPVLWIFGSLDTSTPAAKSVTVLDSVKRATNKRLSHRTIAGANHVGLIVRGEGRRIPPRFATGLWENLLSWIQDSTSTN